MAFFFFFNDTATTEIYTLSLHDALPISALPATLPDKIPANSQPHPREPALQVVPANPRFPDGNPAWVPIRKFAACHLRLRKTSPASGSGQSPFPRDL